METAFENVDGIFYPVIFHNVAYTGQFMTSLVLQLILDNKGYHLNTQNPHLGKDGKVWFKLHRNHGHLIFSALGFPHPSPIKIQKLSDYNVLTLILTTKPSGEWHKFMAHASNEVIKHLLSSVADFKMIDERIPIISQCETCAFTKNHQIISRSNRESEDIPKLIYRISVDLV